MTTVHLWDSAHRGILKESTNRWYLGGAGTNCMGLGILDALPYCSYSHTCKHTRQVTVRVGYVHKRLSSTMSTWTIWACAKKLKNCRDDLAKKNEEGQGRDGVCSRTTMPNIHKPHQHTYPYVVYLYATSMNQSECICNVVTNNVRCTHSLRAFLQTPHVGICMWAWLVNEDTQSLSCPHTFLASSFFHFLEFFKNFLHAF